ncbi:MAG: hypothetical protein D6744_11660 [Planctomycetota bacterium]|nr:MAG: hypothetical protein D6744_11660 [Planctomycetota bacterium]
MARQRKLNKNLIAGLTVTGMVLSVAVVGVTTYNLAKKDPEQLAAKARLAEKAGDPRVAANLFWRAYMVRNEPQYAVESSRVAYEMGEIAEAMNKLARAYAQDPSATDVVKELLKRNWDIRLMSDRWTRIQEYAEKLLELEPENTFALVARASALEAMQRRDASYAPQAQEAFDRAMKIDPLDPYLVQVRVSRMQAAASEEAQALAARGRSADVEQVWLDARAKAADLLEQARDAHPDSVELIVNSAQVLISLQRFDECEQLLTDALQRMPDADQLQFAWTGFCYLRGRTLANQADETEDAEEAESLRARAAEYAQRGLEAAQRVVELEPAYYDVYPRRALLQRLAWVLDGTWESQRKERRQAILDQFVEALQSTVGLRTARAVLGRGGRLLTMAAAFDRAVEFTRDAKDDEERETFLAYAERFRDDVRTEFSESVFVQLMDGQYAALKGDRRTAIQAFREAEEKTAALGNQYARMAVEQLARLYDLEGEVGLALKYTEKLLDWYSSHGAQVPLDVWLARITLLNKLERGQEALDMIDALASAYADDPRVQEQRAIALHLLGRSDESLVALQKVQEATGQDTRMMKARLCARDENYDCAIETLQEILADRPDDLSAVQMMLRVWLATGRHDEGLAFIEQHKQRTDSDRVQRLLRAYEIVFTTDDVAERQKRVLELINEVPDEKTRTAELYRFWYEQGEYAKATEYCDKLESLADDKVAIAEMQFELAIRLKDVARAEKYLPVLTSADADRAGGATYQGALKLMKGDPAGALEEYLTAERDLPTDSDLKVRIAQCYAALNQAEQALASLNAALEIDPQNFNANKLYYAIMELMGRQEEAYENLVRAYKSNPRDEWVQEHRLLIEEEQDPQKGIERREKFRANNPKDWENLLRLAQLYERTQQDDKAEECLKAAHEIEPGSHRIANFAKKFYGRRRNREAGEAILQKYLESRDRLGKIEAYLKLAEFYETLGDENAVLATFNEVKEKAQQLIEQDPGRGRRGKIDVLEAMAKYYLRQKRPADVVATIREMLPLYVESEAAEAKRARINLIIALFQMNDLTAAEKEVRSFLKDYPDDANGWMREGELYVRQRKFEEARAALSKVLEQFPNNTWCLYQRARVNTTLRRYEDAKADFLKLKDVDPRAYGLNPRLELARLYVLMEQYELAENELIELLAIQPNNQSMAVMLIRLLQATGKPDRALAFCSQRAAQQPRVPYWPHQLGMLLIAQGKCSAAVAPLRKAVELTDGASAGYIADWVRALVCADRADEALAVVSQLKGEVVTPLVLTYAAEAQIQRAERDAARNTLDQALSLASQQSANQVQLVASRIEALLSRADSLSMLRSKLAEAEGEPAQRLRVGLARALLRGSDEERSEGLDIANEMLAAAPPGTAYHIEALMLKAQGFEAAGQYEESVQAYEKVLETLPNAVTALNNIAYLLTDKLDRPADAVPYAEQARQLVPDNANVLDTLGWTYYRNGRLDEAETALREARMVDPENLAVLYHLGLVLRDRGQRTAARTVFERIERIATDKNIEGSEYVEKARTAMSEAP